MPVFNGSALLARAICSIQQQTFEDFELIILDNQSTDSTPEICHTFARQDSRLRYIRDTEYRTTHEAASYLKSLARGKYSVYASDDDIWLSDFLSTLVAILDADDTVGMAGSNCQYIDMDGQFLRRPFLKSSEIRRMEKGSFSFWWQFLLKRNVIPFIFGLYRTDVLHETPEFLAFDETGADVDNLFVLNIAASVKISISPKILFGYCLKTRPRPWSEAWDRSLSGRIRYFTSQVKHQLNFNKKILSILKISNFSWLEQHILQLRIIWCFVAQILFKYPAGRMYAWLLLAKHGKMLDQLIMTERTRSIDLQSRGKGYLWDSSKRE